MVYCPSCGAELRFDIQSQHMVCEHCRSSFEPQNLKDKTSDDAKTQEYYDSYAYVCPSCGAEIDTTDKNDAIGFCPYCGGSSMIFDKIRKEWKPQGIIPFMVTKEQCKEFYCKEVKKYIFVSKKYRDPKLIESFRGIYMPYCSFEGTVDGDIYLSAKSKEENIGNYDYQTKYYELNTNIKCTVTEVASHDASAAFDDHISMKLEPFDKNSCRQFHPAYLSGFYAEVGDVNMNEYNEVAKSNMLPYLCSELKNTPQMAEAARSQDLTIDENSSDNRIPISVIPSKRNLFPVWFMSYRRGEKITYAAVNGQTGKVAADLPLSPIRILIAALIFSSVIFGILMFVMNMLPTLPATTTLGVCTMLGLSGMYILQHCYIKTIGITLEQKELTKRLSFGFVFHTMVAIVGIILMTTDGTYEQNRFMLGVVLTAVAMLILLFKYYIEQSVMTGKIKRIKLSGISMQSNGILVEAKKFNIINFFMRTILFLTMLFFLAVMINENIPIFRFFKIPVLISGAQSSTFYYLLAAVAAAELFVLTIMHIIFQSNIAKRRLPQFNKRGAAYDKI